MPKSKARKTARGKARTRKPAARRRPAGKRKPAPIPAGYHTVTPALVLRGAARAIEFYKQAFGARELSRMPWPDGTVAGRLYVVDRDAGQIVQVEDDFTVPPPSFWQRLQFHVAIGQAF